MTNKTKKNCSSLASASLVHANLFSLIQQVRTVITVESFMVFDFLMLAKYSSKENSKAVASQEC